MQPINQTITDYSQTTLIPVINEFLKSTGRSIQLKGGCYGLILLHCQKKFEGKENEYFQSIKKICEEKIEWVLKSDDRKKFCETVIDYQSFNSHMLMRRTVRSIDKNQLGLQSSFNFIAAYPYNSATKSHDQLAKLFKEITLVASTIEKYFIINIGDHAVGISVYWNSYLFNDPFHPDLPISRSFENGQDGGEFDSVVSHLATYHARNMSLSLGIEVVTRQNISAEFEKSKTLQALQQEILKADLNQRSASGATPFMIAIKDRKFDIAKLLISYKADPNLAFDPISPPVIQAILSDDCAALEQLDAMGANLSLIWKNKETPLWKASMLGKYDVVKFLFSKYVYPQKNGDDISPREAAEISLQTIKASSQENKVNEQEVENYEKVIKILKEFEEQEELYKLGFGPHY